MPEPLELREYENILPGSADRIVRMAESAAEARNAALTRLTKAEAWSVTVSAVMFSVAPLALTVATVFAVAKGQDVAAVVTGVAAACSAAPKLVTAIKGGGDRD